MTHIPPLHLVPLAGSRHHRGATWLATVLAWLLLLLALAALCAPGRAQATSITSAASSSGGSWGGPGNNTWTPGGPGAVVAASEVNSRLVPGAHVVVQTHTSEPVLAIKATLTLVLGSHLELQAGGDVRIEAPVQGGTGTLTVRYGQQAVAAGNSATVVATAPVHLQSGATYTTRLGSDGAYQTHTIITSLGAAGSTTGTDLQGMQGNLDGHYVLGSDIDASATSGWNSGAGFEPVGNGTTAFTGSLDGLGHTITGLRIERPGQHFIGLFGSTSGARVRNIGLANAQVRGHRYVGTLAGSFGGRTISSSHATGEVSAANEYAGGLVGVCHSDCTISSSYATVEVSAADEIVGGLVGACDLNCTITSSYAMGEVSAATRFAGGLVGTCGTNCTISSSYAAGAVTGPNILGGLVGHCFSGCTFNSTFYATTDAGGAPINNGGASGGAWSGNGNGTPKTLADLKTLATFSGWSIDDAGGTGTTWRIYPGQSTPLLRSLFTAPLAITATSGSRTVDGTTNALGVTYTPASPDARLLGTPVATAAGSAVGVHAVTVSGVHSTQRGYDITLVPGTLTITAAAVAPTPLPEPEPVRVTQPGGVLTVTDPSLPIVVGPEAGGATIILPGSGSTPVPLQITLNGQPLTVQATPGSYLRVAQVNGQSVLVLVVIQGWASMTANAPGQPMALAGDVLLSAGRAGTAIEAQPLAVAVLTGALVPPQGSLPQLGGMGLQAGERLQVSDQGALVSITLGSLAGTTSQPGDPMAFANLPAAITVDKAFARLNGPLARLSGVDLSQGFEKNASGVFLLRDGGQTFQLLPTLPITIDATLPDGLSFTPLGLLRWVRGGVVVQFAPAVADLAGLANAITAILPDARIRLGAEGVVQLRTGGRTYVLKPGWTGAGSTAGTPQIGVDEQGRIYLQTGNGARQLLLPALLNATQANAIFQAALPGATLAVQPASNDGAFTVTLAGQSWRLVPQWMLPEGAAAQMPAASANWWLGADGVLYLKLGSQVQGVRAVD